MSKKKEIELTERWAVIGLPKETVTAEVTCKIYKNKKLMTVHKTLEPDDIRTAFQKAEDGYIDDDDRFVLTEEGKKYLEELSRK